MVNNLDVSAVPFAIGINWKEMDAPARKTLYRHLLAAGKKDLLQRSQQRVSLCRRRRINDDDFITPRVAFHNQC